jgi:hypothetical protein
MSQGRQDQWALRALSDRSTWTAVDDTARAISSVTNAAWPYAMVVRPQTVLALLAGPTPPWPPAPWQRADRGWLIDRSLLAAAGDSQARPSDTFVGLGSCDGGALLVDLACAPAVISITGDQDAARDLMRSLVTQLQTVPGNRVLMTAGPPSGRSGAPLHGLSDPTGQEASGPIEPTGPWTFLASALPAPADVIRLRARAANAGRMRVLVLGSVTGSRWSLVADASGGVTADGLDLAASGLPAPRRGPERTRIQVPSRAPPALPSGALGPQHAKPQQPPRQLPRAAPRKRPRSVPFWPDSDEDDEAWLSRISLDNPFTALSEEGQH